MTGSTRLTSDLWPASVGTMRDRTQELRSVSSNSSWSRTIRPGSSLSAEEKERDAILKRAEEVLEGLRRLRALVSDLDRKQKTVLSQALPEESLKTDLQTLREDIRTSAAHVHLQLKGIEPKKGEEGGAYVPINTRIQRTQHSVLSREFLEVIGHCNTIQAQYRDRHVERLRRQLKITGTVVSDQELDQMLESGQTDVFTQNILNDARATKQALNEIESRHLEILKLERSIRDLHDIFQYLALEVDAQGETVNRIETYVSESLNYVDRAKESTGKALKSQHKARKKKFWVVICLSVLLTVVVTSLTFALSP